MRETTDTLNFNSLTQMTSVIVLKDSIVVAWPEGIEATHGQILADIPLPDDDNGVFVWTYPNTPPLEGCRVAAGWFSTGWFSSMIKTTLLGINVQKEALMLWVDKSLRQTG